MSQVMTRAHLPGQKEVSSPAQWWVLVALQGAMISMSCLRCYTGSFLTVHGGTNQA